LRETFQDLSWEVLDLRASGDSGVVHFRITGSMAAMEVGQTEWQAVRLREGKIASWAPFRAEREALAAVGLADHAAS
jgi:hypothetical protein